MYYRRRASPKLYNDMIEVEYGGRGHRTRLRNDHEYQLVCPMVPPSTIFHLGHIIAVLRQSPAPVEHHHRHHAIVLTELIPEALLDRSPGSVIELYVC